MQSFAPNHFVSSEAALEVKGIGIEVREDDVDEAIYIYIYTYI